MKKYGFEEQEYFNGKLEVNTARGAEVNVRTATMENGTQIAVLNADLTNDLGQKFDHWVVREPDGKIYEYTTEELILDMPDDGKYSVSVVYYAEKNNG